MTSIDQACFRLVRIALATLLAVFLLARAEAAHAGRGCDKPAPPPAAVRSAVTYEGTDDEGDRRGTGLGLWISRNLIEQNFGGTLDVETEPGVGSCFTATLALARADQAAA